MKLLLQEGWNHFNLNFILSYKIRINYLLVYFVPSELSYHH